VQTTGATALRQALAASPSLASALIDGHIDAYADRLDTVEGQVHAVRRAAEVIAVVPSTSWPAHLTHVVARTGIAPDIALSEVFDAAQGRTKDVHAPARTALRGGTPTASTDQGTEPSTSVTSAAELGRGTLTDSQQAARRAAAAARRSRVSTPPGPPRH
jgi:hypothetical protein